MRSNFKKILALLACLCLLLPATVFTSMANTASATIDFTDIANRVSYSTEEQVWAQNGITVTNNKGASTSNVGDYGGNGYPARFYKSSTLTIAYSGITKIEIDVHGLESKYVTAWTDSLNALCSSCVQDGDIIVATLNQAADNVTIETMAAQARAYSITVYGAGGDTPDQPDQPDEPDVPDTPADETLTIPEAIALGSAQAAGAYTSEQYYVTGKIVEYYGSNYATFGNVYITDESGEKFLIYGLYNNDGTIRYDALETKPVLGDTITVYGVIGNYNATSPQMKGGWIINHIPGTGDEPDQPDEPDTPADPTVVTEPVAGKAYKFGMIQGNVSDTDVYYLKGGMNGYYMDTILGWDSAIDVYLEETDGGYYLYTNDESGAKLYINMIVSGTHVNGAYEATASTVYTYNAESETLIAIVNDEEYWFGTRNDKTYTTVGPVKVSYQGFYCKLYEMPEPDVPAEPGVVANPVAGKAYKFGMIQGNVSDTDVYYLKGGMNGYYMDTILGWDSAIDVYLEETDGGYYLYTNDESGAKLYINMIVSGTHVNGAYEATASTVYTYNAESETLIAIVNDEEYWFGTRNDKTYTTVGPVKVSYQGFYCKLYEMVGGSTPDTPDQPDQPDEPVEGGLVTNPVAGKAYKFGMIQGNVSDTDVYYLVGGMNGYYMATDKDVANAIDVYLEETDGGYYFYTMDDAGAKLYINMVVSGTHVNGAYEATASTVYTYNTESNTITAFVNDADYWFGTRNDKNYTTVGPCAVSFAGFYCQFYTEGTGGSTPDQPDEPIQGGVVTDPVAGTAYKLGLENGSVYYFTGSMNSYYGATSTDFTSAVDMYLEETDGGYHLYFDNGSKQYVNLVISGTHYNFTFGAEANSVFTLDAEKNALCTIVGEETCYMGNFGSYNSISVLRSSKLNDTDYIARLYSAEGGDQPGGDDPDVPPSNDPEADTELSIPAANELGLSKAPNTYTAGKYYVTGKVSAIDYSSVYGNMSIVDDAGNSLYIYGTYSADGTLKFGEMAEADKPAEGDTITVYGIIGTYNGNEAQMKNGWITNVVKGDGPVNSDPAPDTELTIPEAIALGQTKAHNFFTAGKYYVTGKITEVYNDIYGNMYIADDEGNTLTIYGTYSSDGALKYGEMDEAARPVAGDTVKLYGIIGQYNGTSQMKNGWIIEINGEDAPETPDDDRVDDPDREDPGLEDDRDQNTQDPTDPEDDTDKNEDNTPENEDNSAEDEDNAPEDEDNSAEDEDAAPEDDADEDENNAPEDDSNDAYVPEDDSNDNYYGDNSYNDYFPNDDTATDDTIEDDTVVDEGPVEIPEIPGNDNNDTNTNNDQQINTDKRDAAPLLIVGGSMMLIVLAGGAAIILILLKKKNAAPTPEA